MFVYKNSRKKRLSKKFLIGQLARFGDCLYATTIAKQLKNDFPDCHITWAIADNFKSILENNPHVDSIWIVETGEGDYYGKSWLRFEEEALKRKGDGEYDEIIFSQIAPRNMHNFTGTIRESILNNFDRQITVSKEPVVSLSEVDIQEVKKFVDDNNLQSYKHVVLFECAPSSGQSKMTIETAMSIAGKVIKEREDIVFVISSPYKLNSIEKQIVDASILPFKHNAELTKYCSLFVGCSSGLTWLSTSTWSKRLPMIQVLDARSPLFSGVAYDLKINNMDYNDIIEILRFSEVNIVETILLSISGKWKEAKLKFNEEYKVSYYNFKCMNYSLVSQYKFVDGYLQIKKYSSRHSHLKYTKMLFCFLENFFKVVMFDSALKVIKKLIYAEGKQQP